MITWSTTKSKGLFHAAAREVSASWRTAWAPRHSTCSSAKSIQTTNRNTLILVHGFMGNPQAMQPLANYLKNLGWSNIICIEYSSFGTRFEEIVEKIFAAINQSQGQVDLIGHSLGAVACRAVLKTRHPQQVHQFIALGAPFFGTRMYPFAPIGFHSALHPEGEWTKRLCLGPETVPTTVIHAEYDHTIIPHCRGKIPGVQEMIAEGLGHNSLLWSKQVHQLVARILSDESTTHACR